MVFKTVRLKDISKPKQWKNLPIVKLKSEGYSVYGANGIIGYYDEYNHENPTLAITCRGATCGNIHITIPKSYITSNAMALDSLDAQQVDLNYLRYVLISRGFNDVITGSAQPQITKINLEKIKIPLPKNLDDQIHIADLLSQVESLITKREESIRLLDELLKSIFLDMFGDPVLNPKGWDITTLSDLGVTLKGGKSIAECKDNNLPENRILKISAITDGTFKPEESKPLPDEYKVPESHYVKKGDLLMSRANTSELVGATAYVWNTHLNLVLPDKIWRFLLPHMVPLNQMFYWKLSQTKAIRTKISKRATGTGGSMKNISMPKVLSIPIILPPVKIQDKFAAIVQQVEQTKEQHQKSLQELQNLFGSLSQRAFRGELELK